MSLPDPPILVITDRKRCAGNIETRALALFEGGCRFLSLREKDMAPLDRLELLDRLANEARKSGATICVHDDVAAALAIRTALHLPSSGDLVHARRILGVSTLIGKSCHTRAEIIAAGEDGADYVTMSPVFPSGSKPGYLPTQDIEESIDGISLPVLALGGITVDTLPNLPAGFSGVAIMGAAMTASNPLNWFAKIKSGWMEHRAKSV